MSAYTHKEVLSRAQNGERSDCPGTLRLLRKYNLLGETWGDYECRVCGTRVATTGRDMIEARTIRDGTVRHE